jgi:hypothetical protein
LPDFSVGFFFPAGAEMLKRMAANRDILPAEIFSKKSEK